MEIFRFREGRTPLLIGMPHLGTHIPDDIAAGMTNLALSTPDTDWHLDLLYDFLEELGASAITATHSRYVIDLNRPPDGGELYPGRDTTELCPTSSFNYQPLYREGSEPDDAEIAHRISLYWKPYHDKLAAELDRLRAEHGYALLWDAHSIISEAPRFFEGRLTDLNIGTAGGAACAAALARRIMQAAGGDESYSAVLDGRFKGGYITRHYGRPNEGVHAMQLEQSQRTYMDETPPFPFREDLAAQVRPVLKRMVEAVLAWNP